MRNPKIGRRGQSPVVPAYLDEVSEVLSHVTSPNTGTRGFSTWLEMAYCVFRVTPFHVVSKLPFQIFKCLLNTPPLYLQQT
jgi:hypothetical protein